MKTNAILLNEAARRLQSAGVPDPRLDAEYLLANAQNVSRMALLLSPDGAVPKEKEDAFWGAIVRRVNRIPLQYIIGSESFMGFTIKTDSRALIPRPETELLAEKALESLAAYPAPRRVLDLCAGTGAIGLAIKLKAQDVALSLSDLSRDALALAKENADLLGVQAAFFEGDLFSPFSSETFHLIVSNPPYIPYGDCLSLQAEVTKEPFMALCGGADGLDFYRRIAHHAKDHLTDGGTLLMEIGCDQGETVPRLLNDGYTDITVFEDYSHHPRMIRALKK